MKNYSFDNLGIDLSSETIYLIIWGVAVGIALGLVASVIYRVAYHEFTAALMKRSADSPESAAAPSEMKLKYFRLIKKSVQADDSSVRRYIRATEDGRYYIPEEKRIGAELRYRGERRPIFTCVVGCIGLAIVAAFAVYALPELLALLNDLAAAA